MKLLNLTLEDPAENVALDNALVETADARLATDSADDGSEHEILRLWEPARPIVVIGRSSRVAQEIDIEACHAAGAAIVRRSSGGAAIVTGPGCLMYAVVLSYRRRPELRAIDAAHRFVLDRLAASLAPLLPNAAKSSVVHRGTSDLAVVDDALVERKISGNAMRCRRDFVLYHGTLLYDFPLDLAARLLRTPPRQPEYRGRRGHADFITNLPLPRETLCTALISAFSAQEPVADWPRQETARLAQEKYGTIDWTNLL
jgi:lipoate---protein ligase